MRVKVKKIVELDVRYVRLVLPVIYGVQDMPADFPGRMGDVWEWLLSIDEGRLVDWPGPEFRLYMKVCDLGCYFLLDADRTCVAKKEQDYVPNLLIPGEYGYYVDLDIAADGKLRNWPKFVGVSQFDFDDPAFCP